MQKQTNKKYDFILFSLNVNLFKFYITFAIHRIFEFQHNYRVVV